LKTSVNVGSKCGADFASKKKCSWQRNVLQQNYRSGVAVEKEKLCLYVKISKSKEIS